MGQKRVSQLTKEIEAVKGLVAWADANGQRIINITVGSVGLTLAPKPGAIHVGEGEDNKTIFEQYGGAILADYLNREGAE